MRRIIVDVSEMKRGPNQRVRLVKNPRALYGARKWLRSFPEGTQPWLVGWDDRALVLDTSHQARSFVKAAIKAFEQHLVAEHPDAEMSVPLQVFTLTYKDQQLWADDKPLRMAHRRQQFKALYHFKSLYLRILGHQEVDLGPDFDFEPKKCEAYPELNPEDFPV